MKKADAILCADIHLREDAPICRKDDFESAQWAKLQAIKAMQKIHDCPVLCAGDLFHHWKPSPALISKTIETIPNMFYTVYGNHDLPQHSMLLKHKSGVHTLDVGRHIRVIHGGCWGMNPNDFNDHLVIGSKRIALWHVMTYKGALPWPGCNAPTAGNLLKKYPQFDLIVTGDNHKTFVEEYEGRVLVNPGSMTRQKSDQVDHDPCVFLWYAKTNTVEKVLLPFKEGVITREHIENVEERNMRIDKFVTSLNKQYKTTLSFEDNLERFYDTNQIAHNVQQIIKKAIDE